MIQTRPTLLVNAKQIQDHHVDEIVDICKELNLPKLALHLPLESTQQISGKSSEENSKKIFQYCVSKYEKQVKLNHVICDILISPKKTIEYEKQVLQLKKQLEIFCQTCNHISLNILSSKHHKSQKDAIHHQMDAVIHCLEASQAPLSTLSLHFNQFGPIENAEVIKDASKTHPIGLFFKPDNWVKNNWDLFRSENLWVFPTQTASFHNLGRITDPFKNPFEPVTPFVGILDALQTSKKDVNFLISFDQINHQNLALAITWWNEHFKDQKLL